MKFDELCLLVEAGESIYVLARYDNGNFYSLKNIINTYISRNVNNTDGRVNFYLNKPSPNSCFISLVYYNVETQTESGVTIPAKSFKYEVPRTTSEIFRRQSNIFNPSNKAYLKGNTLVFNLDNKPIKKTFPAVKLQETLTELYNVSDFFSKNYGPEYSFFGDIYAYRQKSLLSTLGANLRRNVQDIKNLPGNLRDIWKSLG
jgi:hypothetical protein